MTRPLERAFSMASGPLPDVCRTCCGPSRSLCVILDESMTYCIECGCPVSRDGRPLGSSAGYDVVVDVGDDFYAENGDSQ